MARRGDYRSGRFSINDRRCTPQAAARFVIWETEYLHVLPNVEAIVEWYKGSGLRPFLEAFDTYSDRTQFLAEYSKRIRDAYPPRPNGKILFAFRRLFMVAYRKSG